jgi:hypothetical protein
MSFSLREDRRHQPIGRDCLSQHVAESMRLDHGRKHTADEDHGDEREQIKIDVRSERVFVLIALTLRKLNGAVINAAGLPLRCPLNPERAFESRHPASR